MSAQANTNLTVIIDEQAANLSAELLEASRHLTDLGSRVELHLTAAQFEDLPAQLRSRVSRLTAQAKAYLVTFSDGSSVTITATQWTHNDGLIRFFIGSGNPPVAAVSTCKMKSIIPLS